MAPAPASLRARQPFLTARDVELTRVARAGRSSAREPQTMGVRGVSAPGGVVRTDGPPAPASRHRLATLDSRRCRMSTAPTPHAPSSWPRSPGHRWRNRRTAPVYLPHTAYYAARLRAWPGGTTLDGAQPPAAGPLRVTYARCAMAGWCRRARNGTGPVSGQFSSAAERLSPQQQHGTTTTARLQQQRARSRHRRETSRAGRHARDRLGQR